MKKFISKIEKSSNGIGILDVLFLVFITLKCAGLVTWSWWFVFAPLLIQIGVAAVLIMPLLIAAKYINSIK